MTDETIRNEPEPFDADENPAASVMDALADTVLDRIRREVADALETHRREDHTR